jgi:hypothetical protein
MLTIDDLKARPGEPIRRRLARVVRYLRMDGQIRIQAPARVISKMHGREVVFEPPTVVFPGAFAVTLQGGEVEVGEGLVSGTVPTIEGRRIDGKDAEGKEDEGGKPRLPIEAPESGTTSYVVLSAMAGADGRLADSAGAVEVRHLAELPPKMKDAEGRLVRIVAVLTWTTERRPSVRRIRQVLWYDQEIYRVDGEARWRAAA